MFEIKQKTYGKKNDRVVIVLGGWGTTQGQLWLLGHLLASYKFKAIIFTYSKDILSIYPDTTSKHIHEVVDQVGQTITSLPAKQQKNVSLFGMSLGTNIAFLVANEKKIEKMVINLSGGDFAETIWALDKVAPEIKAGFEKEHITLTKLKRKWSTLSPLNNIDGLKTKEVLLYLAKKDEFIPFSHQKNLLDALQSKTKVDAYLNERHGHLVSSIINLLRFQVYIRFLQAPTTKRGRKTKVTEV